MCVGKLPYNLTNPKKHIANLDSLEQFFHTYFVNVFDLSIDRFHKLSVNHHIKLQIKQKQEKKPESNHFYNLINVAVEINKSLFQIKQIKTNR